MPARRPSGGGCSCIGSNIVDEVDEKVDILVVDGEVA